MFALGAVAVCLFASSARADLEYQFNVSSLGSIQPFSFTFTSATFLADGDVPTFTPFTVTDGTTSWTLTRGLAANGVGLGCFEFGTTLDSTLNPCDVAGSLPGGALLLSVAGELPTATGLYDIGFSSFSADPADFTFAGGTLDIVSLVPEPASIGLLGIVLAIVGWTLRKRPTRELCDGREE
ncbi:MAG: PEP-CTERM sorting domain-containing protein [Bryobacteraceae bacterium]